MADIFHTFFGIGGLSLLKYFEKKSDVADVTVPPAPPSGAADAEAGAALHPYADYLDIDPTYALPRKLVLSLNLPAQTLSPV